MHVQNLTRLTGEARRLLDDDDDEDESLKILVQYVIVKEKTNISDGKLAMEEVLNAFEIIILLQREILAIAGDANDEGTNALMSDYIREQEKLTWMYSAYLNQQLP